MTTTPDPIVYAWHWLEDDRKLGYDDRRPVVDGLTLKMKPDARVSCPPGDAMKPEPCIRGMHASEYLGDTLIHAPGLVLCRVAVWGQLAYSDDDDKFCGTHRHVLWSIDPDDMRPLLSDFNDYLETFCWERLAEDGVDVTDEDWERATAPVDYERPGSWRALHDRSEACLRVTSALKRPDKARQLVGGIRRARNPLTAVPRRMESTLEAIHEACGGTVHWHETQAFRRVLANELADDVVARAKELGVWKPDADPRKVPPVGTVDQSGCDL